ncbi:MAG: four helix bundle protein [Candidatus Marinimicrobia bacterium]|nr:four helix bundle protein [Candidatus Neomarinimicrobiota bacterium]MCF7840258.1 four helix bundle protein [Candidatus Neomarinimicrobiota bacterium]MCF7902621.1 four helix bundle protein [Candidatus Neomarinimicrobiota bacterium]
MTELPEFDHEKLKVYQASIGFIEWRSKVVTFSKSFKDVYNQLDRAAISIPLNIAEGNGKSSLKDRRRFFEIARGSALECAACLDVLYATGKLNSESTKAGKSLLIEIVKMLSRLVTNLSTQIKEDKPEYEIEAESSM